MNKTFVKTKNVKNFIGLIENLLAKPANLPKMALVYGEPGLGKSQTALWLACQYDSVYIRCTNLMTGRWLLEEIVKELEEVPRYLTSDNFNLCVKNLKASQKIVIIDEIDYLANDKKSIETLRDIHDKTNCPMIFVGMGLVNKKLERHRHLYDRFSEIVKFETFSVADVKEIVDKLAEVNFSAEAIELLHTKHNRFRQIAQAINQFETIARENCFTEITAEIAKEVLC
ncbi:MAG TPA: ATP-binding protein [Candidatus Gastranaerophilaceae bacterium]|nr:ATP-binding protein [Candidatus Gastranaerophilaceae bacterium]